MSLEYKCERCGTAPEKRGFDEGIDQEQAAAIRIGEVQTNFGVVWAMCIECRRQWVKWLNNNKSMHEYSEHGFRLQHWRLTHRKTGAADVEVGLVILRKLNELDAQLYNEAMRWFEEGKKNVKKTKARSDSEPNDEFYGGSDD